MSDPVPAVIESEATGEIAAIFADIRAVYRVGVVNLIWRHLATIDGALPWAWHALRPLYVSGAIGREAAALQAGLVLPATPAISVRTLTAADLEQADIAAIQSVLAAYDRTNAMALIALTALRAALSGGASAPVVHTAPDEGPDPDEIPLPRLLALAEMTPVTADLVLRLNRFGSRCETPILASMYRHLAHWPAYLALVWAILEPVDADERLAGAIDSATTDAGIRAAVLPVVAGALPAAAQAPVLAALERFTGDVIARMVVICAILRLATAGR